MWPFVRDSRVEASLEFHADLQLLKLDIPYHPWQPDAFGKLDDTNRVGSKCFEMRGRQMYHSVRHQSASVR